ncbi:BsuBI/PstI family type II restriction endonuclease [Rothia sp. ZJ1223]|uniref:BsuBI/PstI family type II restriction endonuclease n=1 Tax=Rothia sp. ZJ1223 TaxID=2811098 RepID=UPI00195CBE1D|nr:BsuBI/PstI family type II restriction endonuclease [Rothia sp. ZJ1223]MBM7051091.1 restriction endonuclease [Rothia sp. ZJ1223]
MATLEEAQVILGAFGFDAKRTNATAARTFLSLVQLKPQQHWSEATSYRLGVRALLDWMREELDHPIAENSRETIRRFVLHQFVEVGFVIHNEDDPARPTNSSKNNYKINDRALCVIQKFGTDEFLPLLDKYLLDIPSLLSRQREERKNLERIPVALPTGTDVFIKSGGQNALIKQIIEDFCPTFAPGGEVITIGDAKSKSVATNQHALEQLGITYNLHGKFPDVVVYLREKNWLYLIEAASTHGPVDFSRKAELQGIFGHSSAGLVFVSCFPNRAVMRRFIADIAWDTEIWIADEPTHMIHLNGDRFMGPRP